MQKFWKGFSGDFIRGCSKGFIHGNIMTEGKEKNTSERAGLEKQVRKMSHSIKTEMRGGRGYDTENLSNLRPDDEIGALLQQL